MALKESTKGVLAILAAALMFTVMAAGTKFAAGAGVPHGEVTFIRFSSGFFLLAVLAKAGAVKLRFNNRPWLLMRGVFGGAAITCYFFAISGGALTNAVVLNASYPVFVALFSSILIGEKVRKFAYPILLVAFAGIVLVIRPEFRHVSMPDLAGLASAVLAALGILTLRRLRETENVWTILISLNGVGMLMTAGFFLANPVWATPAGWAAVIAVAVSSNLAQVSLTYGYRYIRASEGSILIKVSVVLSAFIGHFVFGEVVDIFFALGAAMVIGSGVALSILIHRAEKDYSAPVAHH